MYLDNGLILLYVREDNEIHKRYGDIMGKENKSIHEFDPGLIREYFAGLKRQGPGRVLYINRIFALLWVSY